MKKPSDQCLFQIKCSINSNYYYFIFFERISENVLHNYLPYQVECTEHNLTHSLFIQNHHHENNCIMP